MNYTCVLIPSCQLSFTIIEQIVSAMNSGRYLRLTAFVNKNTRCLNNNETLGHISAMLLGTIVPLMALL